MSGFPGDEMVRSFNIYLDFFGVFDSTLTPLWACFLVWRTDGGEKSLLYTCQNFVKIKNIYK